MKNKPILSICIPTWNRAKFLEISLCSFQSQLMNIADGEIELLVSDNCSTDNTSEIITKYINRGVPITYNHNTENIGAAANFLKCMNWASGKYILLLGDDDILKDGAIKMILDTLRSHDYGLMHIHKYNNLKYNVVEYDNTELFLKQISFRITFMSGCVFRKDIVKEIQAQKYLHTHLLQMPFFIYSALSKDKNVIINDLLMDEGLNSEDNGGYNFYEVFVKHYQNIWKEFMEKKCISKGLYNYIKKNIYTDFIVGFNYRLLICHRNIMPEDKQYVDNRKGFKIGYAKKILNEYYCDAIYYYFSWVWYLYFCYNDIKKIIKNNLLNKFIKNRCTYLLIY